MKKSAFSILFLTWICFSLAQEPVDPDTLWKFDGVTSLNFSQLSLANWAAGGENSLSGNALVQLSGDFDDGNMNWDNDLILGYGLIRQGDTPARKSDDKIDLSSRYGYRASEKWLYTALLSFRTQFTEGYDMPGESDREKISNFMAPGYLSLSAGMNHMPAGGFNLFISPVSGKATLVMDEELSQAGSFGLERGEKVRMEFGALLKASYGDNVVENVRLDTKISLFSNYLENPEYIDVNWDLLLTFTVNEFLSAKLLTELIYDRDILFGEDTTGDGENDTFGPRVQFKELFGIGFSYNFQSK